MRFTPVADATVKSPNPTKNYGDDAALRVRGGSETHRSFLKFDLTSMTGTIQQARLRLWTYDGSPDVGGAWIVSNAWTEGGVTYNNAPSISGTALDQAGGFPDGSWVEYDVSAGINGPGVVSFGLASPNSNSAYFHSREGPIPPELIVTVTGSIPPPTAAFTTSVTNGSAPLMVAFQDASTGNPSSWAWDINGDGTTDSTEQSPRLAYAQPGTYTVTLRVTNAGGSDTETKSNLITVTSGPTTSPSDPVLVGAGDIASCTSPGDEATADLLDGIPGTVFAAGDTVSTSGSSATFQNCYEPSWGRHKARTRPAAGNHEYETTNAAGYFGYFGSAAGTAGQGWYSFNLGSWHVVVLNSNCDEVACNAGSAQETWLRQDLAANPNACIAAIAHHPRFSSAPGTTSGVTPLLQALYDADAELWINGHSHVYERMAPMTPSGQISSDGIRQITVGTGGTSLTSFQTIHVASQFRDNDHFGVLKLTLHASGYTWQFVPTDAGVVGDVGSGFCH